MLPVSANRGSDYTNSLAPKGEKLPSRDITEIPLNWKSKLPPFCLGLLMPLNQYVRKGITVLVEVSDTDYQGETGLLLYNGGKEEYISNTEIP